ncbi:hypothetical protein [Mucilaginibacter sp. OK098]|uniref:hypothetical protein n=1 Tax=Mucilaginibacter sp. OK098 TaxID=1855297 RepID=UPI000916631F|nr:hypothetical protein [Mucilaginibacter sp. OK098]SHN26182.1 hypothetical protein SAMN05216524_107387 [Mucilaginibacter sp. OK098]
MKKIFCYLASTVLVLASCANLDHINTYATLSTKALESQNSIGYSYAQHCQDFVCSQELYYFPPYGKFQDTIPCDCEAYKLADKALNTLNSVLSGYLTGLGKLSDKKAVNYNYDNLVKAIDVDKIKNIVPITSDQVTSLGKIATTVTNDLMDGYRKKKLKDIIKNTDPDFQILLGAYIGLMETQFTIFLIGTDKSELANRYNRYFIEHKENQTLPSYIKAQYYQDYLVRAAKFNAYRDLTGKFIAALREIKAGHAKLALESDKLTEDTLKTAVNQYSADLYSIVQEFNKLKNSK